VALIYARIKGLKPRATRYLVSDDRGLSLDINRSGVLTWYTGTASTENK
jgi:hypothetical protein